MVDRAYKTGDASVDMKNGAKDMGHDVKNNMKDAYHEAKAGMNERKAEDAAAKREHEEAQRTGDPAAAMRAQQHEQRKDEKGEGFMESVKESIGKAGEAIKDAAVDAKDNVKQGVENLRDGRYAHPRSTVSGEDETAQTLLSSSPRAHLETSAPGILRSPWPAPRAFSCRLIHS